MNVICGETQWDKDKKNFVKNVYCEGYDDKTYKIITIHKDGKESMLIEEVAAEMMENFLIQNESYLNKSDE